MPKIAFNADYSRSRKHSKTRIKSISAALVCFFVACPALAASVLVGLDDLVKAGILNNPSIAAREALVGASAAELGAAKMQYYPTPSIQNSETTNGRSTIFSVTQPLWNGGGLSANVDVMTARAKAAQYALLESKQNMAFSIVALYQSFLQSRLRSEALQRYIDRLEQLNTRLLRRVNDGVSSSSEVDLLDARLAQAQVQYKAAVSSEEIAIQQLSQVTGIDLDKSSINARPDIAFLPWSAQFVFERAESYSPLLRRMLFDIDAANAESAVKRSAQWPSIALVVQRNMNHGAGLSPSSTNAGIQVQYSPGAGFSTMELVKAAEANILNLRAVRDAARIDIISKLRFDFGDLHSGFGRRSDLVANISASQNVLASSERLFIAGKRSLLDVAITSKDLADAEILLADLDAYISCGKYKIYLYVGNFDWME